ncbi:DUF3793 family protein [Parasphaerochaeta coccoides]|uniref:DUF3793 domain-containing protein n=1 Tax=Parasphaerochaeta coccoides (strain ATCC BAA-1237 / DSM 17374 / SPN1) TaxID=760011 RepID=F4GII2_PARC1|nr:DUF3793 family protein [Parasphaerochaeta coccoides]AEC01690.1 hypothetical protein Spico_0462 [Parasphaerochaeta coccoides DSM 17374]
MSSLERTILFHCAPVISGIKPAGLVSCAGMMRKEGFASELSALAADMDGTGLAFRTVCRCLSHELLLVYHERALEAQLSLPAISSYLKSLGYPVDGTLEDLLGNLCSTLGCGTSFPHEVGLFLGYPLHDVLGFIDSKGQKSLLDGYWKVYAHQEKAQEIFSCYDRCRERLCRLYDHGYSFRQLAGVA